MKASISGALPVGTRVRLCRAVDRYPHFRLPAGKLGTITCSNPAVISVRMDDHVDGAEEWGNCVEWYAQDDTGDDFAADVEVIS